MMDEIPEVVLAVYAHPDDADVACGGSLARWAKAGCAVHLVVCTDGGKGTVDPKAKAKQVAALRASELDESSALIGLASVTNLGFPDGSMAARPEWLAMLLDAVSPAAALPLYFPDAGPPHQVATVLLSGTLEPDEWVDVSDTIDAKAAAVECHRTQFAEPSGWAGEAVRQRAEEEGMRAGTRYAEGFRRLTFRG